MRMRHKKHLDEKVASVGDYMLALRSDDLNFRTAVLNKEYIDLKKIFGRTAPLHLEVGCGKGQFAVELARRRPDINILGIELDRNIAWMAAKKSKDAGLTNFKVLYMKAEYLTKYLPENSVDMIYLNFSCPFPKSDYESHRLTCGRFLSIYRELLKDSGEIWQKTDDPRFFEYSIESFSENGWKLKNVSLDLHSSKFKDNIVTEYEQRFTEQGKPIYRLEAYL
ncbi:MAG: tRNA (guanosine(46)-N7)-methyltransferase TrmB [Clostridia bacterium]|nr:tRNA (guanosine(46)-N7)-methyltransferase TrmB [Clostridia bacterium]